jgi:SAM-dependent methyltransferase
MKLVDWAMEHPLVYRAWQAPFEAAKLEPLRRHNDLGRVSRVLDVGCGPGTNAHEFRHAEYLGVDINPRYVDEGRRRHGREFVVGDVTTWRPPSGARFDFILVNSVLHHIDDGDVRRTLATLRDALSQGGHLHLLELVLPAEAGVARLLARADRGRFARPLDHWRELCSEVFEPVVFEPYALRGLGMALWHMVYFKGRAKP